MSRSDRIFFIVSSCVLLPSLFLLLNITNGDSNIDGKIITMTTLRLMRAIVMMIMIMMVTVTVQVIMLVMFTFADVFKCFCKPDAT